MLYRQAGTDGAEPLQDTDGAILCHHPIDAVSAAGKTLLLYAGGQWTQYVQQSRYVQTSPTRVQGLH